MLVTQPSNGRLQKPRHPSKPPIAPQTAKKTLWRRLLQLIPSLCPRDPPDPREDSVRPRRSPADSIQRTRSAADFEPLLELQQLDNSSRTLVTSRSGDDPTDNENVNASKPEVESSIQLPRPPPASYYQVPPCQRQSTFGLGEKLTHVEAHMDTRTLTSIEGATLEHIQQIPDRQPLLKPESEILLEPPQSNAQAFQEIRKLTRHLPNEGRTTLCRDLEKFLTNEQNNVLRCVLDDQVENRSAEFSARLQDSERALLKSGAQRTVTFGGSQGQAAPGRGLVPEDGILFSREFKGESLGKPLAPAVDCRRARKQRVGSNRLPLSRPSLRGGGGDGEQDKSGPPTSSSSRNKGLDFSNLLRNPPPLDDDERPHPVLWWLAGGRLGPRHRAPTAAELRERKRLEARNQEVVGFWGTLFRRRKVQRTWREARVEREEVAAAKARADDGK